MKSKISDQVAESRRLILDSAIVTLMDKGLAQTSMNDIVRASGLSKGGVYHHFQSKDDLIVGILEYFFEQHMVDMVQDLDPDQSAYDKLFTILNGHLNMLEKMGEFYRLLMEFFAQSAHNPRLKEQFKQQYVQVQTFLQSVIEEGQARGEFREEVDAKAIASGLIGLSDGIGIAMSIAGDDIRFPDYIVDGSKAMIEGIRTRSAGG